MFKAKTNIHFLSFLHRLFFVKIVAYLHLMFKLLKRAHFIALHRYLGDTSAGCSQVYVYNTLCHSCDRIL